MRSSGGAWLVAAVAEGDLPLSVVPEDETEAIVARVAEAFVERPNATFWWDCLRSTSGSLHYGRASAPYSACVEVIEGLVGDPSRVVLMLVGIDERHDEAGHDVDGFRGTLPALAKAVAECPGFEFVITDEDVTWAIFDTHHDSVVVTGHPPGLSQLDDFKARLDRE